jgi:hypothetical protein
VTVNPSRQCGDKNSDEQLETYTLTSEKQDIESKVLFSFSAKFITISPEQATLAYQWYMLVTLGTGTFRSTSMLVHMTTYGRSFQRRVSSLSFY